MAKAEQSPPFKMKIESLHLVPASAWDAERLSSYRNGSEVNCIITQEVASWRRRKYWAILGNVVKTCPVRQKRAEDLHKAIRLKLGIVDSFTTLGGATKVELRSTSLMDEPEFEAFYHEAMELLREVTGVDVETLHKESADVGQDETEQPADPASPTVGPGSGDSQAAAPDQSASGGPDEDGAEAETTTSSDAPSSDNDADRVRRMLMSECAENFIRDATSAPADKREEKITRLHKVWLGELPGQAKFVDLCRRTAEKLVANPSDKPKAEAYLAGLVK